MFRHAAPPGPEDIAADVRAEVSAFRLALQADLSVAAAALDADAPQVAADVIAAERAELAAFAARLHARLAAAARQSAEPTGSAGPAGGRPARARYGRWSLPAVAAGCTAAVVLAGTGAAAYGVALPGAEQPAAKSVAAGLAGSARGGAAGGGAGRAVPASSATRAAALQGQLSALATRLRESPGRVGAALAATARELLDTAGPLALADPTLAATVRHMEALLAQAGVALPAGLLPPSLLSSVSLAGGVASSAPEGADATAPGPPGSAVSPVAPGVPALPLPGLPLPGVPLPGTPQPTGESPLVPTSSLPSLQAPAALP